MATVYAKNRTLQIAVPSAKIPVGEANSKIHVAYDEYTLAAELTASDIVETSIVIPAGARILGCRLVNPVAFTTAGAVNFGTSAVPASLIAAKSLAAVQSAVADAGAVDVGAKLTVDTRYQLACSTTTNGGIGKTVKMWIDYVLA